MGSHGSQPPREIPGPWAPGGFWIRNVTLVTVGIAEVLTILGQVVELVGRDVVAHPVARILGPPELAGSRIDVAADAVALAECRHLRQTFVRVDMAILRRARRDHADVAGRANRNV